MTMIKITMIISPIVMKSNCEKSEKFNQEKVDFISDFIRDFISDFI